MKANYGIDELVIKFLQESRPEHNEMEFYYLQQSYSAEGVLEYHLQSFPSICITGGLTPHSVFLITPTSIHVPG